MMPVERFTTALHLKNIMKTKKTTYKTDLRGSISNHFYRFPKPLFTKLCYIPMELIITCNGEHVNTHCSTLGHCNDRLSDKGVLDSLRLAQALKKEKIDFIFCSDIGFRRTTTDLVFETLENDRFQIIVDPRIREK